jgi:PTS system mannose-specific IIA component
MIGLIVISHTPLAAALLSCARHVYGKEPERCEAIDVLADADTAALVERAKQALAAVDDGNGTLVLVDLFGATPGNVATELANPGRVEVVAGVNMPMLLRVLCYRGEMSLAALTEKALAGGASGIMKIASTRVADQQNQRLFPHDPNDPDDPPDDHARLQDQQ